MAEIKIKWYPARSCWRKSITVDGKEKVRYYQHPNNVKGKEAAIAEYLRDKSALTGETFEEKVKRYLPLVLDYYAKNPPFEGFIVWHLRKMLKTFELPAEKWKSSPTSVSGVFDYSYPLDLIAKNWGSQSWELPELFHHLLRKKQVDKNDGSIAYYLEQYRKAAQQREDLKPSSKSSKVRHIIPYEKSVDTTRKISGINNESIRDFKRYLNSEELSEQTRKTYFAAFVQFLNFLEIETDFKKPKELTHGTTRFASNASTEDTRSKKQEKLWSPALFQKVKAALPDDKKLWILLCLNCGFRNTDLSHLKWSKVQGDRLLHQRVKLSRMDKAPVINYKLWDETQRLLKKRKRTSDLVFTNRFRKPYHKIIQIKGTDTEYDGISNWWQKNRINYDLPRLDFLRKTGASFVARKNPLLTRIYLAETLTTVEDVSYVFNDGLINEELDRLTDELQLYIFASTRKKS